jgi:putative phage-type endonuclease
MSEVQVEQGSPEWLEWRRKGIGASDAAAIMGVSPWVTPYQLWAVKRGLVPPQPPNPAMLRGSKLEPMIREAYEQAQGGLGFACLRVHAEYKWMRASLDWLSSDETFFAEFKAPGAEAHRYALDGAVPPYYLPQIMHTFAVVPQARLAHYYSHDGERGVLVQVERDEAYIAKLIAAERAFWALVESGTEPPLTDRDVVDRGDEEWLLTATLYREHEARVVESQALKEAAREKLLSLANGTPRVRGGGVLLTRYTAKGTVDYKKVPELKGVNLDPYRGPDKTAWRVTLEKIEGGN